MSDSTPSHDRWQTCEPGELVGFGRQAQGMRRRRMIAGMGSAAAVIVALVAAGGWFAGLWPGHRESNVGGISCRRVQQMMDAYAAGTLSPEEAKHVREHLAGCRYCRKLFEEMESGADLPESQTKPVAGDADFAPGDAVSLATRD